jgi:tRNA (guanine-N7-)-methyltransferase
MSGPPFERLRRDVVSFVRRSERMTPGQRRAYEAYGNRFVLEVAPGATSTSVGAVGPLDLSAAFGRPGDHQAALIVEIGPGRGDSLVPMARDRPEADFVAFEVYRPAVASILSALGAAEVTNVRIVPVDAVEGLDVLLRPGSVDEVWTFFPDPWPKSRHHKRRIVSADFADLVASRLKPGGVWLLATDWADYAQAIRAVLGAHPAFVGGVKQHARPMTRFEQRGIDAGRLIVDLEYQRR